MIFQTLAASRAWLSAISQTLMNKIVSWYTTCIAATLMHPDIAARRDEKTARDTFRGLFSKPAESVALLLLLLLRLPDGELAAD
jgi:hypothetical protein